MKINWKILESISFATVLAGTYTFVFSLYFVLFAIMGATSLMIASLVIAIISGITWIFVKKQFWLMYVGFLSLWLFAVYANITLGSPYGFRLFFIIVLSTSFFCRYIYRMPGYLSILSTIVAGISYVALEVIYQMDIFKIEMKMPSYAPLLFGLINGVLLFVILGFFMLLFSKQIYSKEKSFQMQNERLSLLANVDPLTELLNRRSINQKLELAMQRKLNLGTDFTVAIGDIDNFKRLNDLYGHAFGDMILKRLSDTINASVRDTDYVCRWGGEEVLILFMGSGQEPAGKVLERIVKSIESSPVFVDEEGIHVTMTFGVASSECFSSVKDIILKADENLYQGKKSGKNCIVYS